MNINDIAQLMISFFPFGFIKIAILMLIGIYLVFSLIIVRQEDLMSHVVEIPFSPLLRLVTLLHFLVAVGAFLFTLILI